jgi:hypothetical protein
MPLKLCLVTSLVAGVAFAQNVLPPRDDAESEDEVMQCVIDAAPGDKPITCEAPMGLNGAPCSCPDGQGRLQPLDR